jgi:hypothetical protein
MCLHVILKWNKKNEFHDAVGMDRDDEEVEPVAGNRVRKERKLLKDEHDGKSKKRARVLVEVMVNDILVFLQATYIVSYMYIPSIHMKTVPMVRGFSIDKEPRALHCFDMQRHEGF